jgi:hypothetical protein
VREDRANVGSFLIIVDCRNNSHLVSTTLNTVSFPVPPAMTMTAVFVMIMIDDVPANAPYLAYE